MVAKIVSIIGPGDPYWWGLPEQSKITRILNLIYKDPETDKLYFMDSMREIKTAEDYITLNKLLA